MNVRVSRWAVMVAVVVVLLAAMSAPAAVPGQAPGSVPLLLSAIVRQQDRYTYCFVRDVVFGNVVIAGGRCYATYLLHTPTGGLLGFGAAGPGRIPPGQLVRLNTPAGAKERGRLFYTLPLAASIVSIPVNTMYPVSVLFGLQGGQLVVTIPIGPQVTTVIYSERFGREDR